MGSALFALMLSFATGWAILVCIDPRAHPRQPGFVLRSSIAGGLGLLASSTIYLACLATNIAQRGWIVSLDLAFLGSLALVARYRRRSARTAQEERPEPPAPTRTVAFDRVATLALVAALAVHARVWILKYQDEPMGFWDSFAIWNLKARFFFLESGEHWRRAFVETIAWSHTDYPLLLPLNVARLWTYAADSNPIYPAILSVLFALLAASVLFGAIRSVRGGPMAFLAVLALFATPQFTKQVTWQLADIPTAFFLAASLAFVLVALRSDELNASGLVIAGLLAGAAAWTKNEGLLFSVAILMSAALSGKNRGGRGMLDRALPFAGGLAVPLLLIFAVKLGVGGANDLAADLSVESLGRLFEFARHRAIVVSFAQTLVLVAGAPLLLILAGLCAWWALSSRPKPRVRIFPAALALALQVAGYYLVYLITERDLAWHLATSNLRLFLQLWPSVLLIIFVGVPAIGSDEDAAGRSETTST